jgi:hypothetical protein
LTTIERTALSSLVEAAVLANGSGLSEKERKVLADSTAKAIAAKVEATFPTQALRAELSAAPANHYFGRYRTGLGKFFDNFKRERNNSGFDIRTDLYTALNPPDGSNLYSGISDKEEVKKRLGTMARLYRALPDDETTMPAAPVDDSEPTSAFTAISTLAEKDYYSSSAISDTPRARFVADVSGESDKVYWSRVHDRATAMRDIAWLKGAELLQMYQQPFPVMRRHDDAPAEAEAGVADWRTLFGSLDMCDCEACASITSPAAYLADILNFLGTEVAVAQGLTPYDVLIKRRPDIRHILLNCDNANREVPYIDLVNELLEDEVLRKSGDEPIWSPYRDVTIGIEPSVLDGAAEGDAEVMLANKRSLAIALNSALLLRPRPAHPTRRQQRGYDFDADMDVWVVARGERSGERWHLFEHGWLVELSIGTRIQRPTVSASRNARASGKKIRVVQVDYISRQTYGTKAELAANPAFRNVRATDRLEEAKFPLSLPPGLPLLETRLFLNHLQVPRERLIRLLAPTDVDGWAIDYLGLSAAEASLITTAPGDARYVTPEAKWGFHETTVTEADSLVDPADSTKLLTGISWTEALSRVDVLITRARRPFGDGAGISYIELLDLLDTYFVNPPDTYFVNPPNPNGVRRISIQSTDKTNPATCDLSKLKITGELGWLRYPPNQPLNHAYAYRTHIGDPDDLFDRLVRFLRLRRRTGWSSRELDLAIGQVGPNVLDANTKTLNLLAALKWTQNALRLGHAETCALFGTIDTRRYIDHAADGQPKLPSQYEQLFQNRAVTNPVDRDFALNDEGTELLETAITLADGRATIAAALQISEPEVTLLAKRVFRVADADASTLDLKALDLKALSDMYRRVLFARGFKLRIQEMIWLEKLAGTLPVGDQIPAFVEQVTWLLRSRLSMTDAWFLLRGTDALTAHLVPRDEEIVQTLGELRDELRTIEAEHPTPDPIDADGTLLRKRLGELDWGEPLIDDLMEAIADTKSFSVNLKSLPATVTELLDPVAAPLASGKWVPKGVEDLVAYDSDNERLRVLRPLARSDRKRLLLASKNRNFQRAVDLLYALGKLSYDNVKETLTCRGLLPDARVEALVNLGKSGPYEDALKELVDQQQQLLTRKLRYCSLPLYEIDLAEATRLDLPPALAAYVYCDVTRKKLVIRGQLTDAEQQTLLDRATPPLRVSRPPPSVGAETLKLAKLSALLKAAKAVNEGELGDLMAGVAKVKELFDPAIDKNMPATTAEIAAGLLKTLTLHARDVLSRKTLVSALSTALGLETGITKVLVERLRSAMAPDPPAKAPERMVDAFRAVSRSESRAPVDPGQYAGLFDDYRRLSKIALLFQRLKVEAMQLAWVFDYASKAKWLDVANLTSSAAVGGEGLPELSALVRLFAVAGRSPYSVKLINDLLRLANDKGSKFDDLLKFIDANTPWSEGELKDVCNALSLSKPDDFISAKALDDLHEALKATNQLGATAEQALRLTKPALGDDDAMLAKSLAKSKHDPKRWLEIVKPITDNVREARRAALVDYLVTNPRRAEGNGRPPLWHDPNSLYEYLLVDVQMGACMTTSRIRLALSSVQLFVQRCLMNLESQVKPSDDLIVRRHWDEWESWRKLYRVWEANRKVFLYPENWIEPDLRDDKTPFFKELENELLQTEVTQETAETAFLNYLHKLDQVGKLEVMGIFIEDESEASSAQVLNKVEDGRDSIDEPKRALHVIARTYGDPHQWFYRKLITTREWHEGIWSPWEKIDADVTGDHILPIVWNHHLYLFWALFEKKADKPTAEELKKKDDPQEPKNRWWIKFAWSEFRNGKWSSKRVSKALDTSIVDSGQQTDGEANFSFKTDVGAGAISIKCYGRQDRQATSPASDEPRKKGQFLSSFSANSSLNFFDYDTNDRLDGVTVFVYPADGTPTELFNVPSKNGVVELWSYYGGDVQTDWRLHTDVEVRIPDEYEIVLRAEAYSSLDSSVKKYLSYYTRLRRKATPISNFTPPPPISLPTVSQTLFSRIGRFDFLLCRSDLQPTPGVLSEAIPQLSIQGAYQSTTLRAMMYVEREGESEDGVPVPSQLFLDVLRSTPRGRYRVLMPHQNLYPDIQQPFFFQDDARAYLVVLPQNTVPLTVREIEIAGNTGAGAFPEGPGFRRYRFQPFYHPWVCNFIERVDRKRVDRKALDEFLTLDSQSFDDLGSIFLYGYNPDVTRVQVMEVRQDGTLEAVTREHVDFSGRGAYSAYNWELFFHAPLLIATRLNANQRFDEARRWFHYIFDPTTRPGVFSPGQLKRTQRFWNVRPFWEAEGRDIHSIDVMLKGAEKENLSEQYAEWRQNPFKPFVVARLRQTAFMQSVVMRYLDNLIDWGDQQFNLFTMESTNEATLLYTLASEILGRSPERIPPRARPTLQTYLSLQQQASLAPAGAPSDAWQKFSNLMVEIEAYISPAAAVPVGSGTGSALGRMWAFCLPNNANLLEYWKRVADRLFKLRHCQDIEGIERKIPLWDPEIDPALLVRAAAAGVDLASILTDINAALPSYRFNVMLQKALELSNEVRNFGAALLAALEKKDGEELAQLRSRHEVDLLQAVRKVKSKQVEESKDLRLAAEKSKLVAEARRDHYRDIPYLISAEQTGLALSALALTQEGGAVVSDVFAAIAAVVPQFHGGSSGFYSSPVVVTEYGGDQVSRAASATASVQRSAAALLSAMSALSHTVGGFQRRQDEWKLQETLAQKEVDQIEKQIDAAAIREEIAEADLASHDKQAENASAVDEYLKGKFTNDQLYGWMQGQLASLYLQAYKLAFDVAKRAERAFRYELGLDESNFVQFGYWDSLKKGLLAGERLQNDLRRMETAYLDKNRREFEITRHVSLAQLNPVALIALTAVGECEVDIPEWLFDMDYPGHYMRRIKSVVLSVPCVVGPYTNVNCTLTQSFSRVRKDRDAEDYGSANHFHENVGSAQAIVTSTAREDSGLFELNFRDERYLPFEGTGAISRWRIQLPMDTNRFDLGTVRDVIFHIRYTARDGGEALRDAAWKEAKEKVSTGVRVFDVRADFATEWNRFKNPETGPDSKLTLHLGDEHFSFHSRDDSISITSIELVSAVESDAGPLNLSVRVGASKREDYSLGIGSGPGDLRSQEQKFGADGVKLDDVVISGKTADAARIKELLLLCRYKLPKHMN